MSVTIRIIAVIIGYLLGCILTAEIVTKKVAGKSASQIGTTGNPGMANVMAYLGFVPGIITLIGDLAKCLLAYILTYLITARIMPFSRVIYLYTLLGCTLGHDYPFWKKFQGGKGVAVTCGGYVLFSPLWGILADIVGMLVVFASQYLCLGGVVIPAVFTVIAFLLYGREAGLVALLIFLLCFIKHYPALRQIPSGRAERTDVLGAMKKGKIMIAVIAVLILLMIYPAYTVYKGLGFQKEDYILPKGSQTSAMIKNSKFLSKTAFSSKDSKIATIDRVGNVTAKAVGSTTITARYLFFQRKSRVQVIGFAKDHLAGYAGERISSGFVSPKGSKVWKKSWSSDNPSVVSVDKTGKIRLKDHGTANITCKAGSYQMKAKVTVTGIGGSAVLLSGKTEEMELYRGLKKWKASGQPSWTTSNPSILSVDGKGHVTARKQGDAVLICQVAGKTMKKKITVLNSGEMVQYLKKGEQKALDFGNLKVSYQSQDSSIASVDSKGLITANKGGKTMITGVVGDQKISVRVCVLDLKDIYLGVGSSQKVHLKYGGKKVSVTSDQPEIVETDGDTLTGLKQGDANLTVIARAKTFRVKAHVITVDPTFLNLLEGENAKIVMQGIPEGTKISWTSEDSSLVSVSDSGEVSANGVGQTVVHAKINGGDLAVKVNVYTLPGNLPYADLSMYNSDGKLIHYRCWHQSGHIYGKYSTYLAWNGCATCTATTILSSFNPDYQGLTPDDFIDNVEKGYDMTGFHRIHPSGNPRTLPLSLHGMTEILNSKGVTAEYVPSFSSIEEAKKDILDHLSTGNPVVFEVRMKNNKTGKKSTRWTGSIHTMILIDTTEDGKVIVADSVNRAWYPGGQRFKKVTLDDLASYMYSSTKTPSGYYYKNKESDGGYIKIN